MVNIVCIKYGRYYSPVYVNRLYAGVRRHLLRPFRFVCVTNDPAGIRPEVECVPFMENQNVPGRKWPNIFSKLTLFKDGFADLEGPTLYLDLDTLIESGTNHGTSGRVHPRAVSTAGHYCNTLQH